jgi:hypothetical protein
MSYWNQNISLTHTHAEVPRFHTTCHNLYQELSSSRTWHPTRTNLALLQAACSKFRVRQLIPQPWMLLNITWQTFAFLQAVSFPAGTHGWCLLIAAKSTAWCALSFTTNYMFWPQAIGHTYRPPTMQ